MIMRRYEEYIHAEVDCCMENLESEDIVGLEDSEYYTLLDSVVVELAEDDDLSIAIEKLVHDRVKQELSKRGVKYE